MADVYVFMGSASDWPIMKETVATLKELGIPHAVHVLSAHRTPRRVQEVIDKATHGGAKVFIAAAGLAAHLAGAVAANTVRPVIGVPLPGGIADGLDALLSTVQMPPGVPVATVAVGKPGAINAAILAAEILAVSDEPLYRRLLQFREKQRTSVIRADEDLRKESMQS